VAELSRAPELKGFKTRLRDNCELEVEKGPDTDMNDLFTQLTAQDIHIVSLRNKTNRLEEMFMRLVEKKGADA
jgi:ABC-2 type transport system ATP-binding protein